MKHGRSAWRESKRNESISLVTLYRKRERKREGGRGRERPI